MTVAVKLSLVTGGASGIGEAVVDALRARGDRVITVDLHRADIIADLSTEAGRRSLAEQARKLAPDGLDLLVACAGVAIAPPSLIIALNYFGAVATLELLRPLLAMRSGSSAIPIVSTASLMPFNEAAVDACLIGDESDAILKMQANDGAGAYATSKRALALWIRRESVKPTWAGSSIFLNGVAPGTIYSPMTEPMLATKEGRDNMKRLSPLAVPDYGQPSAIAEAVLALSGLRSGYVLGQLLFVDGGSSAILRPDLI